MTARASSSRAEWVAACVVAPFTVAEPVPHHPDLLLVLDRTAGRAVHVEAWRRAPETGEVAELIAGLLPTGRRRVHLTVADALLAAALRARAPLGTTVEVGPTPEIAELVRELSAQADLTVPGETPWGFDESATREDLQGFYEAGARFAKAKHWDWVDDGQCLVFDVPDLGWRGGCVTILGHGGETFGLQVMASIDDHLAWVRHALRNQDIGRGPGRPLLGLYFEKPRELPGGKAHVAHARAHGHPARGRSLVPYALRLTEEAIATLPTGADCRLLTVLLAGLDRFVTRHEEVFDGPPEQQVRMTMTMQIPAGRFAIEITAPPDPDRLPWAWGVQDPAEGIRGETVARHVLEYERARLAGGADPEQARTDASFAAEVLSCGSSRDASPSVWSPQEMSNFLLDYYPALGVVTGDELSEVPGRIARLFAWLDSSGRVPAGSLAPALLQLESCREEFLARAADARRYAPAKVLAIGARKAGIDLGDPEALAEFVAEAARHGGHGLEAGRWKWDGQGEPPSLADPCPCGSGKRYKKCCLPR